MLRERATASRVTVEIGVAEGASAWEAAQVMPADGLLYLIDPYELTSLPVSPAQILAKRLVSPVARGEVRWITARSHEARVGWTTPIDFLFIDGDHSYDGARRDWDEWTPLVRKEGFVALHDAHPDAKWTRPEHGPVRIFDEALQEGWELVSHADSLVVLKRR